MKILCGTDFSPNSKDALAAGAALAQRFGDALELVHAMTSPADDGNADRPTGPTTAELQDELESWAAPLRSAGLDITTRLELGNPVDVLDQLADELKPRWIVLSSIGRVALIRIVLGSTADRVAERAPAPTLVVRRGLDFSEWQRNHRPLRVFVAANNTPASDHALALVRDWASAGPVELHVGQVMEPAKDAGGVQPNPGVLERQLREQCAAIVGGIPFGVEIIPPADSTSDALIHAAKAHRAGVLFTGTTQARGIRRLWHRSVSRALLADAPMNVAVVPAPLPAPVERP
ncbi:MAG: universal stress protein [Verrucomicrobiales bacterium]|nr:universal stress protein [Verrucomicrobiales bacterium]